MVVKLVGGYVGSWEEGQDLCASNGGILARIPDMNHFYQAKKVCKAAVDSFIGTVSRPQGCWINIKKEGNRNPLSEYFGDFGFGGTSDNVIKNGNKPPWIDIKTGFGVDGCYFMYYFDNYYYKRDLCTNTNHYWRLYALCEQCMFVYITHFLYFYLILYMCIMHILNG